MESVCVVQKRKNAARCSLMHEQALRRFKTVVTTSLQLLGLMSQNARVRHPPYFIACVHVKTIMSYFSYETCVLARIGV